jgi:hypothetical protein
VDYQFNVYISCRFYYDWTTTIEKLNFNWIGFGIKKKKNLYPDRQQQQQIR